MLDVKKILKNLNTYNVKYIVVGGTAAIAQGSLRLTFDLDLCYARDKENLESIVKALSPFNPYLRGTPKDLPFIFDAKTLSYNSRFMAAIAQAKKLRLFTKRG